MAFDLTGKVVKDLCLPTVDYGNFPIKIISAQEGDVNSRFFRVTLFDDRGTISLEPYTKVILSATLPNGELHTTEGEIDTEKNVSICKIAGSMLSRPGKVSCDVLYTGNDNNNDDISLTSQTFYLNVAKSQTGDSAIEGGDDKSIIVAFIGDMDTALNGIIEIQNALIGGDEL